MITLAVLLKPLGPLHNKVPLHPLAVKLATDPAHTVAELTLTVAGTVQLAGAGYVKLLLPQMVADDNTLTVWVPLPELKPVKEKATEVALSGTLTTVKRLPSVMVTLFTGVLANLTVPLKL